MEDDLPTPVYLHSRLTSAVSTPPLQSILPCPSIRLRCSAPTSERLSLSILRKACSSRANATRSDCHDKTQQHGRSVRRSRLQLLPGSRARLFLARPAPRVTLRLARLPG